MYLELAEGERPVNMENYVWIPSDDHPDGGYWTHIRMFDDLTPAQADEVAAILEPYQTTEDGMMGLFGNIRDRIRERQQARQERKMIRTQARAELIRGKAAGIRAGTFQPGAAAAHMTASLAPVVGDIAKLAIPGGAQAGALQGLMRTGGSEQQGGGGVGGFLDQISGTLGNIFGGGGGQQQIQPPPEEKGWFAKNWPIVAIGGIIIIGGVIFFTSKKK